MLPIGIAFNLVMVAGTLWYWQIKDWMEDARAKAALEQFPELKKMLDYFGPTPDPELLAHTAMRIRTAQEYQARQVVAHQNQLPACPVGRKRQPGEMCIELDVPDVWVEFAHLVGEHACSMIEFQLGQWKESLSKWWQVLTVPADEYLQEELRKLLASPEWMWRRKVIVTDLLDKMTRMKMEDSATFGVYIKDNPHLAYIWTHKNRLGLMTLED